MDGVQQAWEGVARDVLESTGCDDPPVDAFELADCCGLNVFEESSRGARREGTDIYIDGRARTARQHGMLAHEIGHWALERAKEANNERGARYMAGALLLPRRPFERDIRGAWDLDALRARHVNASAEMIARRVVNLDDAVISIWDNGRLTRRIWSPWLPEGLWGKRATRVETRLAAVALETGEPVREHDRLAAWPIFEDGWRRVIVLAEAEQLSLRL